MSKEIAEEYASSLSDLTVNSKPLINMLTILAEENIDHAGVIVDTVEKHLAKVDSDIKLPVLYLVDSIVKNVGGAYIQKFSQCIVNMFTRTFKAVDEKVRSQMFKLRETWHDVFPAMKLYQLDVKVNLLDPAWPIQAQPSSTSSIHVNPNFLKKSAPTTSAKVPTPEEDENIRSILAKKEQELLMLQQKKIEIELQNARRDLELQNTRRALEIAASTNSKSTPIPNINAAVAQMPLAQMPVAMVTPVPAAPDAAPIPIKQRLGPPVNKAATTARIAPVSAALAAARRDPRLARRPAAPAAPAPPPRPPIAPNVFDIKPLERVTKRKNVITIDVRADAARRDPRPGTTRPDLTNPERIDALREKIRVHTAAREARRDDRKLKALKSERKNEQKAILDNYMDKLQIADAKKINKLPPIPKINREPSDEPLKRKKDAARTDKKKKRDSASGKDSAESSPEKKPKTRKSKKEREEADEAAAEVVAFKALRNYHPERYMRRNRARSPSPDPAPAPASAPAPAPAPAAVTDSTNATEVVENKDVDLRVLHPAISDAKAAPVGQKRSSTEGLEPKPKKSKSDKFDRLFGNEDVDLRQLPQVEETTASVSPKPAADSGVFTQDAEPSPPAASPKKDWNEVKEREETKKTPSKLDLVRAKLAEATKGHDKDRLGRPFLFSKSPSVEKERRRTVSTEDVDLRLENTEEFVAADHKKTINIIMDQAQEQYTGGKIDNDQYKTLLFQVFQLNEKLKLKEAKQRESLEISKLKLKAHIDEEVKKIRSPKVSPKGNNFGDIDERVIPAFSEAEAPLDAPNFMQDSDMRMSVDGPHPKALLPRPPMMPMFGAPHPPMWRGPYRPRMDDFQQRPRGVVPPFFRGKFDRAPRFEPRVPFVQPLPTPQMGTCQGECPLEPYVRTTTPPPLGAPSVHIPSTNIQALEYIDLDPIKTIQIDGIPREIRFYGETAIIMLDWDDPREIKFLPGSRRVTFDNKDSVVLNFNEPYKQVEIEDQVFDIRFGAPTRELFINGRWHECFFGGAPLGVIIDGKPRLIHLEGPLPQVDIGKVKRTDLVAGKINLIVDATRMCPVFLDSKVQKFSINGKFFTIRFVDALRTVLINEQPFQVEFGGLPRPVFIGNEKHFIRFSVLPRHVRPGFNAPADMQGAELAAPARSPALLPPPGAEPMETDQEMKRPVKTPSPEGNQGGLDMLASVMPSPMAPASASSDYSSAEPIFLRPATIPGLDTPATPEETPAPALATPNINDLFAKLLATGIIQVPAQPKEAKVEPKIEEKKPREDRSVVHRVDLGRPETLRVKQPALVAKLYGGMQCSGCGARFPPEHTVRYSQHLDWHFRQNRRERDSARRAHSRDWHYDLADWLQYEELEDLEERKKSWFETTGLQAGPAAAQSPPPPSVAAGPPARAACALCGDAFLQFYNEDREEWHLRNSVSHEGENYHPLCLEDYKASQTKKEEQPKEEFSEAGAAGAETGAEGADEAIEIRDGDDADQSDNESVVEVIEPEKTEIEVLDDAEPSQPEAPLDVEADDDEDDVVFKAEPVVQLVVDDYDTDDETAAARGARDEQAKIDFANVRVKQEPIDPDDEPIITSEEEAIRAPPDTSRPTVMSTIDGNVLDAPAQASALPGIRINISKPLVPVEKSPPPPLDSLEDVSADEEPPPPGEEPELEYKLKPSLEGVVFSRQPPKQKGTELSGLCSIM